MTESKRIKKFRLQLAKEIPKFPNDAATKNLLEQKPLADLLIDYMSWRVRFVAPRPRTVGVASTASSDPRWQTLSSGINLLLTKVRAGDDLTPHLSLLPITKGFTPISAEPTTSKDRWADKDFLLNVMSFHHFHIGLKLQKGHISRTDDLLFALVSRDHFDVLGIFDHEVFESTKPNAMPAERARLWKLYTDLQNKVGTPGAVLMGGMGGAGIALSGHPVQLVHAAMCYRDIICQVDPQLDDPAFLQKIFAPNKPPSKPKLRWEMHYLDLALFEETTHRLLIFQKGPN